jgi:hypothetical protein
VANLLDVIGMNEIIVSERNRQEILGQIVEAPGDSNRQSNFEREAHYSFRDGPLVSLRILCGLAARKLR